MNEKNTLVDETPKRDLIQIVELEHNRAYADIKFPTKQMGEESYCKVKQYLSCKKEPFIFHFDTGQFTGRNLPSYHHLGETIERIEGNILYVKDICNILDITYRNGSGRTNTDILDKIKESGLGFSAYIEQHCLKEN